MFARVEQYIPRYYAERHIEWRHLALTTVEHDMEGDVWRFKIKAFYPHEWGSDLHTPAPGINVTLYSEEAGIRMSGVTDELGYVTFTIPAIRAREYALWAYAEPFKTEGEIVFMQYARTLVSTRIVLGD